MFKSFVFIIMIGGIIGCGGNHTPNDNNASGVLIVDKDFSGFDNSLNEKIVYVGKETQAKLTRENIGLFLEQMPQESEIELTSEKSHKSARVNTKIQRSSTKSAQEKLKGLKSGIAYFDTKIIDFEHSMVRVIWDNYSDSADEGMMDGVGRYSIYHDNGYILKTVFETGKLHLHDATHDGYVSGTIIMEKVNTSSKSIIENIVIEDTMNKIMVKRENFISKDIYFGGMTYHGKIYVSTLGYIEVSTEKPIKWDASYNQDDNTGEIHIKGKNSKAILRAAKDKRMRVELDENGDGVYDSVMVADADTYEILENLGPSLEGVYIDTRRDINETHQSFGDENINLRYMSRIYDRELDGIVDVNVTFLVNDKIVFLDTTGNDISFSSDYFKKHDIVKIEIRAKDALGNVSIRTETVKIINAPPRREGGRAHDSLSFIMNYNFKRYYGKYIIKNDSLALYASDIEDIDGDALKYRWFVGLIDDKNKDKYGEQPYTEVEEDFFHVRGGVPENIPERIFTPTKAGYYHIGLEVSDGESSSYAYRQLEVKEDFGHVSHFEEIALNDEKRKRLEDIKDVDNDGEDELIFIEDITYGYIVHFTSKNNPNDIKGSYYMRDAYNVNKFIFKDINNDKLLDIIAYDNIYIQNNLNSFTPIAIPQPIKAINIDDDEALEIVSIKGDEIFVFKDIYTFENPIKLDIPVALSSDNKRILGKFEFVDIEGDGQSEILRVERSLEVVDDNYNLEEKIILYRYKDGVYHAESLNSILFKTIKEEQHSSIPKKYLIDSEFQFFTMDMHFNNTIWKFDLNGDDKLDFIHKNSTFEDVIIELSQDDGSYLEKRVNMPTSDSYIDTMMLLDVNRDGIKDLISSGPFDIVRTAYYFEGEEGFNFKEKSSIFDYTDKDKFDDSDYIPYDYNGDGYKELLLFENSILYVFYLK